VVASAKHFYSCAQGSELSQRDNDAGAVLQEP
jgi:hypothetical protein